MSGSRVKALRREFVANNGRAPKKAERKLEARSAMVGPDGRLTQVTSLVKDAHKAGLLVHIWTFRPENYFLAGNFKNAKGDAARNEAGSIAEMRAYITTGIDGFFTDDPALGRKAVAI